VIPAARLEIVVEEISGERVRLGLRAPTDVDIWRDEIWREMCFESVQGKGGKNANQDHERD
jgi:sRNA-binding carbon storage regulator CsrA